MPRNEHHPIFSKFYPRGRVKPDHDSDEYQLIVGDTDTGETHHRGWFKSEADARERLARIRKSDTELGYKHRVYEIVRTHRN